MKLAEAFRYCPRCATPSTAVGRNPLECAACGFTFYFSPVIGVVCVIANPQGEVVMFVRRRDPGRGLFGLPGGFVDPGESADAAASREVREEVGLEVTALRYLGSFPNNYEFRGVVIPVTDLIFQCQVASFDGLRPEPQEIERLHICRPGVDELGRMAFESNRLGLELFLSKTTTPTL